MTALKIIRGPQHSAARVTIYGPEGLGKSTLAAKFPNPLVLDTEDGTKHLDVARVVCDDWRTLTLAITELAVDPQGFKTVVIDSADWAEKLLVKSMLAGGKKSIEDYGFGKGYVILAEHFTSFLASCDKLIAAGLNVVFVAHCQVKRTSPPDQTDGFDRYELKLTKQVAPLLKEWCDALIFATYKTKLVEGADGRTKAVGSDRVMYADRTAAWDGKNRFGLPSEMPMTIDALGPLFGKPAAKPAKAGWLDRVAAATTADDLAVLVDDADAAEAAGDLTPDRRKKLDAAIAKRRAELEPQEATA